MHTVPQEGPVRCKAWYAMQGLGHPAKKVEIDAILEHFNIDAANPIICLTQVSIPNPANAP